jgi:penicillin-binding protein 1A
MLPSLSDRTKWFLVYSAILGIAVGNVVFGMDWVSEPGPKRAAATAGFPDTFILLRPAVEAPGPLAPTPKATAQTNAPTAAEAAPKCDVAACAAAYRTFRESDCSYQPSLNERRLCTKGRPPQ